VRCVTFDILVVKANSYYSVLKMSESSEIMDEYEQISQRGRGAYCRGKLQEATMYFEEALKIEQEIHLKAVLLSHRKSRDSVSSSVRDSVCSDASSTSTSSDLTDEPLFASSPISQTPPSTPGVSYSAKKYPEVLRKFRKGFGTAEKAIAEHPEEESGYLQKGAILCALNSWDQAREIYCQGIRRCTDGDKLRQALATINRLENLISTCAAERTEYDMISLSTCSSGSERSGIEKAGISPKQSSPSSTRFKQVANFFSRLRNSAFSPKLVPLNDTAEHKSPRARSVGDLLADEEIHTSPKLGRRGQRKCLSVSFDDLDFHPGVIDSTNNKKQKRRAKSRSISFDDL